ncbi:unnamed protein product [Owenia fusiformis]|uniref:Uncharacterized protein n=1 Tax=Owenia fusiformis TaxID=6347 RepID=A0A8J1TTG2_OWEFU|nr:unnamed protein product [Owenia fusiformis]
MKMVLFYIALQLILISEVICGRFPREVEEGQSVNNKSKTDEDKKIFNILRCNQRKERYISPGDWRELQLEYYECVNSYYQRRKCPEGLGVGNAFVAMGSIGIPTREWPCLKNLCIKEYVACPEKVWCPVYEQCDPNSLRFPVFPVGFDQGALKFCGLDIVVALDISCSISEENKTTVKNFMKDLIKKFTIHPVETQIGGLTFGQEIHNIQTLKQGRNKPFTLRNFDRMVMTESKCITATDLALEAVRDTYFQETHGERAEMKNVLIVTTDGQTHYGRDEKVKAAKIRVREIAEELRTKRQVQTYTIALPSEKFSRLRQDSEKALKQARIKKEAEEQWLQIAGSEDRVFTLDTFEELGQTLVTIAAINCRNIINYYGDPWENISQE